MDSRIRTALLLYAFAIVGLFLLVAPWTGVWSQAVVGLMPLAHFNSLQLARRLVSLCARSVDWGHSVGW